VADYGQSVSAGRESKRARASALSVARRNRTQYTGSEYDHMCGYCGYIYDGPDTGKRVPAARATHTREYNGTYVSHGACDPPCEANTVYKYVREKEAQQGPVPGRREQLRAERNAEHARRDVAQAEQRAKRPPPPDKQHRQDATRAGIAKRRYGDRGRESARRVRGED
jgi:hypothetical protein